MTIDWSAFLVVAVSAFVGACAVVTLFALGLRLLGADPRAAAAPRRAAAYLCFALCVGAVLLGVYLIVPALSG